MKSIKKFNKMLCVTMVAVLLLGFSTIRAYAANNMYGYARNYEGGEGSYFYATIQSLNANRTSSNPYNFILHTTWVGGNDKWIENGFMDGAIQEPGGKLENHHGYYTAIGSHNESVAYSEYKIIGPSTSNGTSHAFQIQRDGTNKWGVYVDYTLRRTYTDFSMTPERMSVGLETNTTQSTSAQWNERAIQRLTSSGWKNWSSGALKVDSGISASWDSQYTSIYTSKSVAKTESMEEQDIMYADSMQLVTNPDPVLKGNSEILEGLKNGRSDTIAEYNLNSSNGEIAMNEYMTYADFLAMEGSMEEASTEIAGDRVVFVAKVYYPEGFYHIRGGFIENCMATGIYDAETGEYLGGSFKTIAE